MTTESTAHPHKRINAAQVCDLCGGVSDMSLHRWLNSPELDFPKPIYIARRRYWREADVIEWLDARKNKKSVQQLREEAAALVAHADALEAEGLQ